MVIFVVDDEANALEYLVDKIQKVEPDAEICQFNDSMAVLEAAKTKTFDVIFMDIEMPKLKGVDLAKKLKKLNPKCNIVFVTGYSEYMGDAFALDASGYLLKPATKDQVRHALDNLRYSIVVPNGPDITAQCFGDFDIFYKGKPIKFKYNKAKEVLAFLIDRRGATCTNNAVIAALWEDDDDHSSYFRAVLKDLHDTFEGLGVSGFINRQRAGTSIDVNMMRCDYYDYINGKIEGINAYKGEYMSQYEWAEETAGMLYDDMYGE